MGSSPRSPARVTRPRPGTAGPASSASVFYTPMGVAVDGRGGVYITGGRTASARWERRRTIADDRPGAQKLAPPGGCGRPERQRLCRRLVRQPYARSRPAGRSRRSLAAARAGLTVTAVRRHRRRISGSVFGVAVEGQAGNRVHQRRARSQPGAPSRSGWDDHDIRGHGRPGLFWRRRDRATSAWLTFPMGLAVDGKGNVYIADRDDNRVRKVWRGPLAAGARPKPSPSAGGVTRGNFKTPSGNIVLLFAFSTEAEGMRDQARTRAQSPTRGVQRGPVDHNADWIFLARDRPRTASGEFARRRTVRRGRHAVLGTARRGAAAACAARRPRPG